MFIPRTACRSASCGSYHFTCISSLSRRGCRTVDGCRYDDVRKFMERTVYAAWLLSALNNEMPGCMRSLPTVSHFPSVRSSCLIRSENSVPGATRGTGSDATAIPGSTIAPGVHVPRQFAAYLVVGVMSHTDPTGAFPVGVP